MDRRANPRGLQMWRVSGPYAGTRIAASNRWLDAEEPLLHRRGGVRGEERSVMAGISFRKRRSQPFKFPTEVPFTSTTSMMKSQSCTLPP